MGEVIYAARMKEFNKKKGHLRRNVIILGRKFSAGNSSKGQRYIPSPFVIITKDEAKELLKKHHDGTWEHHQPGRPYLPVFDVFEVKEYDELMKLAKEEANHRSSQGVMGARALINGQVAKILADKPIRALTSVKQIDREPPPPSSKIESVEDKPVKPTEEDPFAGETEIEGMDKDELDDLDDDDTKVDPEAKKVESGDGEEKEKAPEEKAEVKPKSTPKPQSKKAPKPQSKKKTNKGRPASKK